MSPKFDASKFNRPLVKWCCRVYVFYLLYQQISHNFKWPKKKKFTNSNLKFIFFVIQQQQQSHQRKKKIRKPFVVAACISLYVCEIQNLMSDVRNKTNDEKTHCVCKINLRNSVHSHNSRNAEKSVKERQFQCKNKIKCYHRKMLV